MKFHQMPPAVALPGDSPEMREAIALLKADDIDVRRPGKSRHQLKLDERTNYYPSKGTFYIDGADGASPERGLPALKAWIAEHSLICAIKLHRAANIADPLVNPSCAPAPKRLAQEEFNDPCR